MNNFHLGSSVEQEVSKKETINRTEKFFSQKLLFGLKLLVATVYLHENTYWYIFYNVSTRKNTLYIYIRIHS